MQEGSARCHARTLTAPEILHPLLGLRCCADEAQWRVAEQLWRALPKPVIRGNVLAVCDVSTSMFRAVSVPRPIDVAVGLSLYLAEHNRGAFRNMVLTLEDGCTPLRFQPTDTLADRVSSLVRKSWSNADVGAVLAFLLRLCTENRVPPEDLPVLVFFSDMEFDAASGISNATPLFDAYRKKFASIGLPLPRVVFWNICNRTATVPMRENEAGLVLASGFSEKIMKGLLGGNVETQTPWEALKEMLDAPRFATPFG